MSAFLVFVLNCSSSCVISTEYPRQGYNLPRILREKVGVSNQALQNPVHAVHETPIWQAPMTQTSAG